MPPRGPVGPGRGRRPGSNLKAVATFESASSAPTLAGARRRGWARDSRAGRLRGDGPPETRGLRVARWQSMRAHLEAWLHRRVSPGLSWSDSEVLSWDSESGDSDRARPRHPGLGSVRVIARPWSKRAALRLALNLNLRPPRRVPAPSHAAAARSHAQPVSQGRAEQAARESHRHTDTSRPGGSRRQERSALGKSFAHAAVSGEGWRTRAMAARAGQIILKQYPIACWRGRKAQRPVCVCVCVDPKVSECCGMRSSTSVVYIYAVHKYIYAVHKVYIYIYIYI